MKRFSPIVISLFVWPVIAGCGDSGPVIGPPAEVKGGQTSEFKEAMEKAGKKMQSKGKPKASPDASSKGP